MEQAIRLILLAVGIIVVLWILYDGIKRQKQRRGEECAAEEAVVDDVVVAENIVVESVAIEDSVDHVTQDVISNEACDKSVDPVTQDIISNEACDKSVDPVTQDIISNEACDKSVDHVTQDVISNEACDKNDIAGDIIMMMIVPEQGKLFSGDKLLQILFAHDLHYGDKQIFHYYSATSENLSKPLFSVASASPSGDFDLNSMRENSYRGLVVFMEPEEHLRPAVVFDMMVEIIGDLAISLHGKLLSKDQQPWSTEMAEQIRAMLANTDNGCN